MQQQALVVGLYFEPTGMGISICVADGVQAMQCIRTSERKVDGWKG